MSDDEFGVDSRMHSNLDRGIVLRALAEFPREFFLAVELRGASSVGLDDPHIGSLDPSAVFFG